MLFTQFNFIFGFLPVTLAGYFLIARFVPAPTARLLWLAAASLVFYGYWNVHFLPVIAVSIVLNYLFGYWIIAAPRGARRRRVVFVTAIAANLLALGFFKYTNFAITSVDHLLHLHVAPLAIELPLGISFFTFTQIAYLADVFAGHPSERNFTKYVVFVTYFPHLIAGPILHHREMMPQFGRPESRYFSAGNMALGLTVFAMGLFKKAVVADGMSVIADPVFQAASTGAVSTMDAWAGALGYSLQIYFDFSGYSDMALGLSTMFGIVLPFNFDSPYKARSIAEFWHRWHITLSRFLRDYLYIPLGGSRKGERRRYVNLLLTMILGGMWHGAGWTFILWGTLHGLFLVINHGWARVKARVPSLERASGTIAYALAAFLLTQLCVVVAWVFFRATSFKVARRMLAAMLGLMGSPQPGAATWTMMGLIGLVYLGCVTLPNANSVFREWKIGFETYRTAPAWSIMSFGWRPSVPWAVTAALVFVVDLFACLVAGNASPFLYFQF